MYNNTLHFSSLCAGYLDRAVGSCNGDSGGALACEKAGILEFIFTFDLGIHFLALKT